MNKQLRRLGAGLLACYLALFAMVNYVQVFHADALNRHPKNTRATVRDFDRPRGQIVSADGAVLAQTLPSAAGDRFAFQRTYPEGDLFAGITGYLNFNFGATGVESTYNDELSGKSVDQSLQTLRDLFVGGSTPGDVTLTVRKDLQQLARDLLGEQRGSVVAIDPRDGSILAMWGFPSFDPNPLSSHDLPAAQALKDQLEADRENKPLRARAYQERAFPGSTFKIITAAIGVETGKVNENEPSFPALNAYDPPDGEPISNFGGSTCGGALFQILRVSCNSAFAEMGAEVIGSASMKTGAERFGFNNTPPIDLPGAVQSAFPDSPSKAFMGQASIGQFNTAATPLQMAMAAGAIGNGGIMMTPHVMKEVRDDAGRVTRTFRPTPWRTAMSPATSATMREAMVGVVASGTGSAARISGLEVGGKTGTAQLGTQPPSSHAWFVCFAGNPGEPPSVAVAVLVEGKPGVSETTGGTVAAPIARQIIQQALTASPGG